MFTPPTGGLSSAAIAALTELLAAGFAAGDELVVNDVSASQVKKVQAQNLLDALLRVAAAGVAVRYDTATNTIRFVNATTDASSVAPSASVARVAITTDRSGTPTTWYFFRGRLYLPGNSAGPEIVMADPGGSEAGGFQGDGIGRVIGNGYTGFWASHAARAWVGPAALGMRSDHVIGWGAATNPSATLDTALARAAAKVVGLTDGSSGGGTLRSVPLTPAQITAGQNDYAPGVARFYRLSTDAARTITGLSVSQVDGQECELWNVGGNNIVLAHQSASSTAANRFICTGAADITLAADEIALLRYDGTTSRWRVRKV